MSFTTTTTFFGQYRLRPSLITSLEFKANYQKLLSAFRGLRPNHTRIRVLPPDPRRLPTAGGRKRKSYEADTIEPLLNVARVKKIPRKRRADPDFPVNMDVDDGEWTGLTMSLVKHWCSFVCEDWHEHFGFTEQL